MYRHYRGTTTVMHLHNSPLSTLDGNVRTLEAINMNTTRSLHFRRRWYIYHGVYHHGQYTMPLYRRSHEHCCGVWCVVSGLGVPSSPWQTCGNFSDIGNRTFFVVFFFGNRNRSVFFSESVFDTWYEVFGTSDTI